MQDPTEHRSLFQILTDWQDKKGDRRFLKLSKDHDVGTSVKHGKPKKQKLEGKGGHGTGPGPGRPKSKNLQPKIQEYEFQDDPIDVPRIPKNDAPNRCVGAGGHWDHPSPSLQHPAQGLSPAQGRRCPRGQWGSVCVSSRGVPCSSPSQLSRPRRFWASVEPYCADLTNEEVRVLEELLKPPEDEAEHYKVKNSRAHPVPPKPIPDPLSPFPASPQPLHPLPCLTASVPPRG